jgi:hypothetical protein
MRIKNQLEICEFLSKVSARIRFKDARSEVELEMSRHLEEVIEEGIRDGKSPEEATQEALKRMGNPEEIGDHLDFVHRPAFPWPLLFLAGGMIALGIFSALEFNRLGSHAINIVFGVVAAALFFWIRPPQLLSACRWIFVGSVAFLGAATIWGEKNQGLPFLSFFCFNINALDFTVAPLLISLSAIVGSQGGKNIKLDYVVVAFALLPSFAFALFGSTYWAILFSVAALSMIVTATVTRGAVLLAALGGAVSIWLSYNSQNFLSAEAFNSARISEAHTDFVLAHLQERSGFLGLLGIFLSLALIAQLGLMLREIRSRLGKVVVSGHLSVLALSILWSVLANLGYVAMPAAGTPLPLVSYGGSILVGQLALFGLSIGFYRRRTLTLLAPVATKS